MEATYLISSVVLKFQKRIVEIFCQRSVNSSVADFAT